MGGVGLNGLELGFECVEPLRELLLVGFGGACRMIDNPVVKGVCDAGTGLALGVGRGKGLVRLAGCKQEFLKQEVRSRVSILYVSCVGE